MTRGEKLGALLLLVLAFSGKARAATSPAPRNTTTRGLPMSMGEAWRKRVASLLGRAASGARWVPALTRAFAGNEAAALAGGRWVGIESGGNPLANTKLNERGLAQVMQSSAKELGITPADFADMANPSTSEARHAELAVKVMLATTRAGLRAAGFGTTAPPGWGELALGLGKLRHGLPLMLRELTVQKLVRPEMGDTIRLAATAYKPSARTISFVAGAHALTGSPRQDLVLRFMAPAAVVAFGEAALRQAFDAGNVS